MPKKPTKQPEEMLLITKDTKIGDVTTYCQEVYFKELAQGKTTRDTKKQRKAELLELHKKIEQVFTELNIKCFKCDAAVAETFAQGAELHPFNVDEVVKTLNDELNLNMALIKEEEVSK